MKDHILQNNPRTKLVYEELRKYLSKSHKSLKFLIVQPKKKKLNL